MLLLLLLKWLETTAVEDIASNYDNSSPILLNLKTTIRLSEIRIVEKDINQLKIVSTIPSENVHITKKELKNGTQQYNYIVKINIGKEEFISKNYDLYLYDEDNDLLYIGSDIEFSSKYSKIRNIRFYKPRMVPSNDKGTIVYDSKTEKIKKDYNSCNIFDLRTKNSFKASLEILEHRKEFIKSTIKTIRNLSRYVDGYEQNLKKNNKDIEELNLLLAEIASNLAVKNSNRESDNARMLEEQRNRFTIRLHKHTIKKRTIESEIKKVKTELRKEQNHILNMFEIHFNTISEESSVSKYDSISSELSTNNAIYGLEMNLVGSPENSEGYFSRSISKTETDDENNDNLVLMNSIIEGETSTNLIANDNVEDSGNAVKQKSISADSLTEPENKSLIDSDVEEDMNESESSSDIDFDKDKETNELNGSYTDILSGIRNDVTNDEKDIGQSGSVHSSSLMNKVPCIPTDVHESSTILEQKADDVLIKNVPVIEFLANDETDGNLIDNGSLSKDELVIQQTPNEASKDVMLQAKSVPLVSEDNQKPSMNEVVNDTTHNNGTILNLVKDQNNNSLSPSPPKPFSEPEPEPKTDDKNSGVDERYIWIGSSVVVISASLAALYLLKYRH